MKAKDYLFLFCALLLVFLVEIVASLFTAASVKSWYPTLVKAPWTPPPWVFGPVWTVLYILIALALFFYWRKGGTFAGYFFWGLQLFLNFIWSFLFFTLQSPLLGLIDLILLCLAVLITGVFFFRVSIWAGILLIPYFIWITYALSLNAAIWMWN